MGEIGVNIAFLMDLNSGRVIVRGRLLEAVSISCVSEPRFPVLEVVRPLG